MTGAHRWPVVTSATPAASGERFNSSAINQMHISRSLYRLGAEALGWDNSTAEGKALIAEDMKLLKRLYLAKAIAADVSPPTQYRIGHGG